MKVVDIAIQVTCLEEDVITVMADMNRWFCENETALVQRPRTGGITSGEPRPIQPWMKKTLCPERV